MELYYHTNLLNFTKTDQQSCYKLVRSDAPTVLYIIQSCPSASSAIGWCMGRSFPFSCTAFFG